MPKWDPLKIEMYLKAIEKSDYPRVFIDKIFPYLNSSMTVLDIGSGPGAFTLGLAPHVKQVYALEQDALAQKQLLRVIHKKGLSNIECIYGSWPSGNFQKIDLIVSAFTGPFVMSSRSSLAEMVKTASSMVFLIAPARKSKTPFCSRELYYRQGNKIRKHNYVYTDITRTLKELGIEYNLELIDYDFGQPVTDKTEGEIFLTYQLPFSRQTIRNHLQEIITKKNGQLWIPNPMRSALISIKGSGSN